MVFDEFTYKRLHKRRRTRRAFLLSLTLHALAIALISLSYITWYRPMMLPETMLNDTLEVTTVRRFHTSSQRKRSMPKRRAVSSKSAQVRNQNHAEPIDTTQRVTTENASIGFGTEADLPFAETRLSDTSTKKPEWKSIAVPSVQSPTISVSTLTDEEHLDTLQEEVNAHAEPVDRDGEMGEALTGIAESISDTDPDSAVDIIFLLDISGSMIDNIRAVGRQLITMVSVFEEKGIDFKLGIVIFRYLEGDTITHQPTRDVERYKQLLTTHVVAAAGDERAHNAIIKAIRRVEFRKDAKRRFVLVTDEASKGTYNLNDVLLQCWENRITMDVIGINHHTHRALTSKTGGLWYPIPKQE